MSATQRFLNAARPLFRRQPLSSAGARSGFRSGGSNSGSRRWQSAAAGEQAQVSWFKRMWDSPIGVKTVHFWAPVMKWGLVLAGIADFARPVETLSLTQNLALTATGAIWTRWCLIIKPKNYLLAAVNFFLAAVGTVQVARITLHDPKDALGQVEEVVAEKAHAVKEEAKKDLAKITKSSS